LLLDREAPDGFGWWRELTGSGLYTARARRELFYAGRPTQLPDLSDLGERRDLMAAALHAARDLRSTPHGGPQIPAAGEDPDFDGTLEKTQFGNPLALVMAGVIALDQGPRAALALRHLEAARRLGRRELDRFAALAQTRRVSGDAMRHIVAFNELVDGFPVADLRRNAADELAASRRSADLDAMLALLQQELPPRPRSEAAASGPRIATIQPDLIGEAAIIDAFSGDPAREAEAKDVVNRAYASAAERAARVLVRLLQDFAYAIEDERAPEQEKTTARRLMDWLLSLSQLPDPEHLMPLVFALPEQTTILREPAAELTQRLAVSLMQEAERSDDPGALATAAALLTNLANRLSDLGRREEALSAAEEAVRHYRALAAVRPEVFTADLALSFNNLGAMLSALGRREEALTTAEEAVRLRRALAASHPDAFTPNLAASLNNLGIMLSDLGRREEALSAAEEAVRHYRALAACPDAFTPDLARSLNSLGNILGGLGRREEARSVAEEAVRLRRALAASHPDAFGTDLARSLWVLGDLYGETGKFDRAVETLAEAVRLLTPVFVAVPAAVSGMMDGLIESYSKQSKAAGREPDAELLQPVIAQFERIKTEEGKQ
jgi:tetratricopeptide (TPR) repeat protein